MFHFGQMRGRTSAPHTYLPLDVKERLIYDRLKWKPLSCAVVAVDQQ